MANSADPDHWLLRKPIDLVCTVCKGRTYQGSAGLGLILIVKRTSFQEKGLDIEKMLNVVNLRFFHLIGGKCINGRKLEPFGDVFAGPPGQLSLWTCFPKITNKKVITTFLNQAKTKNIEFRAVLFLNPCPAE